MFFESFFFESFCSEKKNSFPPLSFSLSLSKKKKNLQGVDLVQAQVRIAGGATLADLGLADQSAVKAPAGFAIQCRITCEVKR